VNPVTGGIVFPSARTGVDLAVSCFLLFSALYLAAFQRFSVSVFQRLIWLLSQFQLLIWQVSAFRFHPSEFQFQRFSVSAF